MLNTVYVLKHKNEYEREERKRRKQEIDDLRADGVFRVALNKEIGTIRTLLDDEDVEYVDIEVSDEQLVNFHAALNFEELKEFKILQGRDATVFRFMRKEFDL